MNWETLIWEVVRRSWTLTLGPAYFMDGISGTKVELADFDPDGDEEVLREIVRIETGQQRADPAAVLAAALRLCRELDPEFSAITQPAQVSPPPLG